MYIELNDNNSKSIMNKLLSILALLILAISSQAQNNQKVYAIGEYISMGKQIIPGYYDKHTRLDLGLDLWVKHVLLTFAAPLRAPILYFCQKRNVLPALLPLMRMWRPHDYETIEYNSKFDVPSCFWYHPVLADRKTHSWLWPKLYLYHIRLLERMTMIGYNHP